MKYTLFCLFCVGGRGEEEGRSHGQLNIGTFYKYNAVISFNFLRSSMQPLAVTVQLCNAQ